MARTERHSAAQPREDLSPRSRRRSLLRWRRPLALLLAIAVLGSIVVLRDPVLRLGARSLVSEWSACLLHGDAPSPQPGLSEAFAAIQRGRHGPGRREPSEAVDLPVVSPQSEIRARVTPHPDRPVTVPRQVVVAILDSGVTATQGDVHPDHVLPGVDLVNPCGDGRQDVTGHGTAVAGVLLSSQHGAAPLVEVLPIRISLATGRHSSLVSALGIVTATNRGADIINMSYTAQRSRPSIVEWLAVRYADRRGVALVAPAGNDPTRPAGFPAAYPQVLSVTAIDADGELSAFATRTGHIDVAAPGSRVLTLAPDGGVRVASGTSLAAPIVSASLVHLLRADPAVSPGRAVALVRETSGPPPSAVVAHRFGSFDFAAALGGVCAISSACLLTAVLQRDGGSGAPVIGDRARLPRPGEPR